MSYWADKIGWRESILTLCGWFNESLPVVLLLVVLAAWARGCR